MEQPERTPQPSSDVQLRSSPEPIPLLQSVRYEILSDTSYVKLCGRTVSQGRSDCRHPPPSEDTGVDLFGRINRLAFVSSQSRPAAPHHVAFGPNFPVREAQPGSAAEKALRRSSESSPAWPAINSRSAEDERHQPQATFSDVCLRNRSLRNRCQERPLLCRLPFHILAQLKDGKFDRLHNGTNGRLALSR